MRVAASLPSDDDDLLDPLTHSPVTHHLQRLLLSLRRRGTAVLTLTPFKPLMTSMTSPPSLARDETVTVINCDAHVDTTNHPPTTPTRPVQPTERPAGAQGERTLSSPLPFSILQRLSRQSVSQTTSSWPKASEQTGALSPLRDMPCCVPASAQLPDTITLASRTIFHLSCRSSVVSQN